MRLSEFYTRFRRQRSEAKVYSQKYPALPRQTMTLEAMTRPAQTKSLKGVRR